MDLDALTGYAAFASAIIVFCGSVWLLLAMVLGGKLAYFVSASVTLGFLLIMGVVWSINPLGPVGELPEWLPRDLGQEVSSFEFGPAGQYPEGGWEVAPEDDAHLVTISSELESAATDYLEQEIEKGNEEIPVTDAGDLQVKADSTLLLEQDGTQFGMLLLEPIEDGADVPQGTEIAVAMEYDPKNPLGLARRITLGTLILFALHLFGLSQSETKSRRAREAAEGSPA